VGNNWTGSLRPVWVAVLAVAAASCSLDNATEPSVMARQLGVHTSSPPVDDRPQFVVASMIGYPMAAPQPAPLGEIELRQAVPELREAAIVVGTHAAHVVDDQLMAAFLGQVEGITARPANCPDRDVVDLLMVGKADFGVIGGPLSQREQQAGLRQSRIGVELFALSIAPNSPVKSLTRQQVRQIFTGEVTSWQQLGYDGGAIVAVIPSDRAMAERAARALIPGDSFASTCLGVPTERHVVDQFLREPGAIGVVRLTATPHEAGQKLLQIDWCQPSLETFGWGTYPYGLAVHVVTQGQPAGVAERFVQFARGDEGRALLGRTLLPLQ